MSSFLYDLIAHFILYQKFFSVISWYFAVRNKHRISDFRLWIGGHVLKIKKKSKIITNNFKTDKLKNLKYYLNINNKRIKALDFGFKLLVGRQAHFDSYKTYLDIFFLKDQNITIQNDLVHKSFLVNITWVYRIIVFEWIRNLWFRYKYISRWYMSNKNFRRYHLKSYFHDKVFVHNKFYHYMYIKTAHKNQTFCRRFLKYHYMNKHLSHKVRNISINVGTLSLFYVKVLSDYLVPSNWRLNFTDYNQKYSFNPVKKMKHIYSNYPFFLMYRDSCVWNFSLKKFHKAEFFRRDWKKHSISQKAYKNLIYKTYNLLINRKLFSNWFKKSVKKRLWADLTFAKGLVDNRFFNKPLPDNVIEEPILIRKSKKKKLNFNKYNLPVIGKKRKPVYEKYFYNTDKRFYRLDNKFIWIKRKYRIFYVKKKYDYRLWNIPGFLRKLGNKHSRFKRSRSLIKPSSKLDDLLKKTKRYKVENFTYAFKPRKDKY